jgi:hypothetical protein
VVGLLAPTNDVQAGSDDDKRFSTLHEVSLDSQNEQTMRRVHHMLTQEQLRCEVLNQLLAVLDCNLRTRTGTVTGVSTCGKECFKRRCVVRNEPRTSRDSRDRPYAPTVPPYGRVDVDETNLPTMELRDTSGVGSTHRLTTTKIRLSGVTAGQGSAANLKVATPGSSSRLNVFHR